MTTTNQRFEFCHSRRDRILQNAADKLLRKAKFFPKREPREDVLVEAEMISANGTLKSPVQGRA